jgi:hypothetical protein
MDNYGLFSSIRALLGTKYTHAVFVDIRSTSNATCDDGGAVRLKLLNESLSSLEISLVVTTAYINRGIKDGITRTFDVCPSSTLEIL